MFLIFLVNKIGSARVKISLLDNSNSLFSFEDAFKIVPQDLFNLGSDILYVWKDLTSSSTLKESLSLFFSILITLGLNLSRRDLKFFLTTLDSIMFSPKLKLELTILLNLE